MAADSAPDWLGACRRSADAIRAMLSENPTIAERVKETGTRGEGGDRTLLIDAAAEDFVFAELE
jgi:myo-inositol-1(or 4)-monophosphatase